MYIKQALGGTRTRGQSLHTRARSWYLYYLLTLAAILPTGVAAQGLTTVTPPDGTAQNSLPDAVLTILNALLALAALAVLIAIIYGGVQYISSQGDEDAAASAKGIIIGAILYLIVIGLAAAIVNFIVLAIQG